MARVRVLKTAELNLSACQIALATRTHEILAKLSCDINPANNFDLNFNGGSINFFSPPRPKAHAGANGDTLNFQSTARAVAMDPFNDLTFDPQTSQVCALFLIVRLPGMSSFQYFPQTNSFILYTYFVLFLYTLFYNISFYFIDTFWKNIDSA